MFSKAIVKQPCKNMISGITTAGLGQPEYELALTQHGAYVRTLEACGLTVTTLPAQEAYPDSVFIEDTCLMTPRCAVITNPGADSRKGETAAVRDAVAPFGLPVETISAPGTLDAGDIMMVGTQFYVGLSDRTNPEGYAQLSAILGRYGMGATAVPLKSVLHLKTGISYLENDTLLVWGEFTDKPELAGFDRIRVPEDEGYAANSLWINDIVLVPEGYERTRGMIEQRGYKTLALDVSEFRKLDGGLSCLSLRF